MSSSSAAVSARPGRRLEEEGASLSAAALATTLLKAFEVLRWMMMRAVNGVNFEAVVGMEEVTIGAAVRCCCHLTWHV